MQLVCDWKVKLGFGGFGDEEEGMRMVEEKGKHDGVRSVRNMDNESWDAEGSKIWRFWMRLRS